MRIRITSFYSKFKCLLLSVLLFLIACLNAKSAFYLLHVSLLSKLVTALIFFVLGIAFIFKKKLMMFNKRRKLLWYVLPLISVFLFKYASLYISSPSMFLDEGMQLRESIPADSYQHKQDYVADLIYFSIIFPAMVFLVVGIDNIKQLELACFYLTMGGAVYPLIGVVFFPYMIGSRAVALNGVGLSGGFWNPAVVAFVTSFWLMVALWEYSSFKRRGVAFFSLLLILLGSLVGLSRSAGLCVLGSLLGYLFFSKNFKKKIYAFVFIFFGAILFIHFFDVVIHNFQVRLEVQGFRSDSRIHIWQDYWANIGQYWLAGAGAEGFKFYSADNMSPHSIFLSWLVRTGILGLLAFLWFLYGVFLSVIKVGVYLSREKFAMLIAWLVSYMGLVSFNNTGFITPSFYMALCLILVWGELAKSRRTN